MKNRTIINRVVVFPVIVIIFILLVIGGYILIFGKTSLIRATPTINPTVLTIPDIILYYPFNGNANDMSGNRINGKVIGPTLTSDRFDKENSAYYFDGINDSITFDASMMPLGESPRTISAWIRAEEFPPVPKNIEWLGSRATIIGWGLDDIKKLCEMEIVDTHLQFHKYTTDNTGEETLITGKWYHLVIVYSASSIDLYVNGKKESFESQPINTVAGEGRIGAFPDQTSVSELFPKGYDLSYFHGIIDDIAVYKRALTYEQVISLYNEGGWK